MISAPLTVELARESAISAIKMLQQQHGGDSVEDRPDEALREAVYDNRIFVVRADQRLVAVASYFVREHSVEIGGLVVDPEFKRLGIASFLAKLRVMRILVEAETPLPIISETYPASTESLSYQSRNGFRLLDRVPAALHQAAWETNARRAVVYCVADPFRYRDFVADLLDIERRGVTGGAAGQMPLVFGQEFRGTLNFAHRILASREIENEVERLRRPGVQAWLESVCRTDCITRSRFLRLRGLDVQSWGHGLPELDTLAAAFRQQLARAVAR